MIFPLKKGFLSSKVTRMTVWGHIKNIKMTGMTVGVRIKHIKSRKNREIYFWGFCIFAGYLKSEGF